MFAVLPLLTMSSIMPRTLRIAKLQLTPFLKPYWLLDVEKNDLNLSKMQCSKALDSMGLIAIPLKSSQFRALLFRKKYFWMNWWNYRKTRAHLSPSASSSLSPTPTAAAAAATAAAAAIGLVDHQRVTRHARLTCNIPSKPPTSLPLACRRSYASPLRSQR